MTPPALRRSAPISIPNGGQTGQVVGVPGENVLYVVGHTNGRVHIVKDGMATGMSLINPPLSVSGGAGGPEAGFLSIALHPEFAKNKLFYVFYTGNPGGRTVVDEYERLTDTTSMKKRNVYDRARANNGPFHNGGTIYFSPKDEKPFIYLSIGDHQQPGSSRAANGVAGRILKIDVAAGMAGVTSYGHGLRNPYRMSIDRGTGDMWIGDVGNGQGGAVKFKAGGSEGVTDFGWTGGEVPGGISGYQVAVPPSWWCRLPREEDRRALRAILLRYAQHRSSPVAHPAGWPARRWPRDARRSYCAWPDQLLRRRRRGRDLDVQHESERDLQDRSCQLIQPDSGLSFSPL